MDKALLAAEANAYLTWLEELARSISPHQGVASRLYRSEVLTAYSRYSMRKLAVQGAPSICIADITVEQPGHGFFEVLCNQFEATTDCSTQAEALFVENVSNRRFATWLKCRGFLQCPYSDPALPTLYLTCPRPFRNR